VPQANAIVVERLGGYLTTWSVGLHFKAPFIDRVAKKVLLKEQVVDFPPQPVITKDNVTMQIDTVVYFQITDPKLYAYGVENPIMAIENLTATTLRNIIGDLELDETLTSRETINTKMRSSLDVATDPWGIKVNRVELKNIIPPAAIQDAMEKQMKAERERREAILRAEGEKKSTVLVAEGKKESAILDAEAEKQAAILRAEAHKEATIREAEGQAEAILKIQQANADGLRMLKEAAPDAGVLQLKSLEAFAKAADGKATKIIIPSEIQGIAGLAKSVSTPESTFKVVPSETAVITEGNVMGLLIALIVLILVALAIAVSCIKIVPQANAIVVERLGGYLTTWSVGLHFKAPFIDRVAKKVLLKEQVVDFPPQPVITKDNVTMQIDTVVYFQITDPKLYAYGVENPIMAIENLTATTLRNIIGDLELDETLTSRETINTKMRSSLDVATDPWGIKVNRVELKNIIPPAAIQDAMEKQMKAERERREAILRAEGEKKSTVLVAEGKKESAILDAEAEKQAAILRAEAHKEATIREAEGQAEAILKIQQANADGLRMLKEAAPDAGVLQLKSLEAFAKAADGKATKIIIPSEIQGIAGLAKSVSTPESTFKVVPSETAVITEAFSSASLLIRSPLVRTSASVSKFCCA
jgi:regulator of protease activity HflC (stomatin/prohibitin superfamily)